MAVTTNDMEPRVYVACLACYNAGKLHGEWFDAEDGLGDAVAAHFGADEGGRLACGGEELLCHDSEGFCPYELGEASVPEAERVGAAIRDAGEKALPALLALANGSASTIEGAISYAEENYRGTAVCLADFAEQLHEDMGTDLGSLASYVDWERVGRDLELGGDVWAVKHEGELHVFWNG